jgi:putative protease
VDASNGNRKIDINLTLAETETGYELSAQLISPQPKLASPNASHLSIINYQFSIDKITANNPEKATENIRKKALQWGDTVFNPVNLELQFAEPRLIPASVIGEMKRQLVTKLTEELIESHRNNRQIRCTDTPRVSTNTDQSGCIAPIITDPDAIPEHLMTCHHCIRYANGMCSKETGQKATPLWIRNGNNVFRLEFDCRNCLMYVLSENN